MTALLFALLASLGWGVGDFLGGTMSRRLPSLVVVGVSQAIPLVLVGVGMLAVDGVDGTLDAARAALPWASVAGVVGVAGLYAFYHALSVGTMGVVAPLASLGVLVPVAVGLLGGDTPTGRQGFGMVLAVIGVLLSSGPELRGGRTLPVVLSGLAAVCFGTAMVATATAGESAGAVATLLVMRATSVVLLAVPVALMLRRQPLRRSDASGLTGVGITDAGANLAYIASSQAGMLSLAAVLSSLFPAVTAVLARIVHGERMTRVQHVGLAVVIAGVALIAG